MLIIKDTLNWNKTTFKSPRFTLYLNKLNERELSWEVKSPELINFQEWMLSKI
jgi:hypothetical protein